MPASKSFWAFFAVIFIFSGCVIPADESPDCAIEDSQHNSERVPEFGGGSDNNFKVPLPVGYNWEVTQSWAEHCELCNEKGYDSLYDEFFGNYCTEMSHASEDSTTGGCYSTCKYGWDFNLPGNSDEGKSVLASSDGTIKKIDTESTTGWGNYVIIDHGNDVCTRYAHLKEDSITVTSGEKVCQGLKVGEIGGTPNFHPHLHFQFEKCSDKTPLKMGFTDGNGIPVCTVGSDVFNSQNQYSFLRLTNLEVEDCGEGVETFSDNALPNGGWVFASCGSLQRCPLIPNCGRVTIHEFTDEAQLTSDVSSAANYLYSECALDGKNDGGLHPLDNLTRAEALKIPLFLFGLMGNCGGTTESFNDVDENDWYFTVVACAVKYRIIDTVAAYFNPTSEVTFAEAAKFVVESASKAGVIQIQNPSHGHFPRINSSHWAYRYVETLYAYGGIVNSLVSFSADDVIYRKLFVTMVASLSPCFCGNVICQNGCVCDQATFSCRDPSDTDSETGGWSEPRNNNDGSDGQSSEGEEEGATEEVPPLENNLDPDLSIDCGINVEDERCSVEDTVLPIRCTLSNNGDRQVRVNNLVMAMTEPSDFADCRVTDANLQDGGVGTQNFDPGEERELNYRFEITCSAVPPDHELEVSFDLIERISGETTTYADLLGTNIPFTHGMFVSCHPRCVPNTCDEFGYTCGSFNDGCGGAAECGACPQGSICDGGHCREDDCARCPGNQCVNGQCVVPEWVCDPLVGYNIHLFSPGGNCEVVTSGPQAYAEIAIPLDSGMRIHFDCIDLPSALLLHGGPWIRLERESEDLPAFAVWAPYERELMLNPPFNPDAVTNGFASSQPNLPVLFRFPAQ